jgi:hypothetical protein
VLTGPSPSTHDPPNRWAYNPEVARSGHALSQPLIFIPYYLHTNPVGVRAA